MKKIVFCSYPDFSDNSYALFKYMIQNEMSGIYIWLYTDETLVANYKETNYINDKYRVKFVKKNSFSGILNYIMSNYIFTTHGMFEKFPIMPWQKKINLWHGMPLKKIGSYLDGSVKMKMTFSVSTGVIFNRLIAEAFEIEEEKVLKVGYPRNDLLNKTSAIKLSSLFEDSYDVIAWLPTYRKTTTGVARNDGSFINGSISGLHIKDFRTLNSRLEIIKKNIVIKLHPMDSINDDVAFANELNSLNHIKIITNRNNPLSSLSIYEIIQTSDSLITDYSSIYFDYLLLDRPIGIFSNDKDIYSETRGLFEVVKNNFLGYEINNLDSLLSFIGLDGKNREKEISKLKQARKIFQTYDTQGRNSNELLKKIGLL